jgi:hypothetical protein
MPLSAEVLADLDRLRRAGKGPKQLFVEARRQGVDVTIGGVREYFRDYADDKGQAQLAQERPYRGKIAAEDLDSRWQADLAIYAKPRRDFIGFLLVMDAFSRSVDAEPIRSKSAKEILRAFLQIVRRFREDNNGMDPLPGIILTTDLGSEFKGAFRDYLEERGGAWRARQPGAKNDLSTLDRAMGSLKKELRILCIDNNTSDWPRFLEEVLDNWNQTYNESIHGSPNDVHDHEETYFLNMQDQARKFALNDRNEERMKAAVTRFGRFRPPALPTGAFRNRVFSKRFAAPQQVDHTESGVVVDRQGKEHTLKLVQPLGMGRRAGQEVDPPPPPPRGRRFRGARGDRAPRQAKVPLGARRGRLEVPEEAQGISLDGPPPGPPPLELPAGQQARLELLKRYRGLLVQANFRPLSADQKAFVDKWGPAIPYKTNAELVRAIRMLEG